MRMAITAVAGFIILMAVLAAGRDALRPPQEADLGLAELTAQADKGEMVDRLGELAFDCTQDKAGGTGQSACFAPTKKVDSYEADYLALFFDKDDRLAAAHIVLDPSSHKQNRKALAADLGEPARRLDEPEGFLLWEPEGHIVLTHAEPPAQDPPMLMWYRDTDAMERLQPR